MQKVEKKSHSVVYGIIGMLLLFLFGGFVGYILNGSDRVNHSTMSAYDCNAISNKIIDAARNNQPDLIAQLNKVYSENCLNRDFKDKKKVVKTENKKLPAITCEAIEELLKKNLSDENSNNWMTHEDNAHVYQNLAAQGCESNKEKYLQLAKREKEITKALKEANSDNHGGSVNKPTCEQIQVVLEAKLICKYSFCHDAEDHIQDAQIYANLSERGCAENSEAYKNLAKQELEIARALTDDRLQYSDEQKEATKIVETYKRLQMRAEAAKMIEKAKKLANPAIDFIIQLEKIIEE